MAEEFTPEELAEIELLMRSGYDPLAISANQFGQGSDYLGYTSQPDEFDRLGEMDDLYSDLFRMTRTYMPDYVPDLYPEVEDPGMFQGYRSDQADLYRNNQAFQALEQMMAENTPFEEAVQLIVGNPDYEEFLPKNNGRVDPSAFRSSAEQYVAERSREGREYDNWSAEDAAYQDFIRSRTGMDMAPGKSEDEIAAMLRPVDQDILSQGRGPKLGPEGLVDLLGGALASEGRGPLAPQAPAPQAPQGRQPRRSRGASVDPEEQRMMRMVAASRGRLGTGARDQINQSYGGRRQIANAKYDEQANNQRYNEDFMKAFEATKKRKEGQKFSSKKEENLARLLRFRNTLLYGE